MMATLQSCSGTNSVNSTFCLIAHPIYISPDDKLTDPTARQILDHDDTGRKLCGWTKHRAEDLDRV